MFEIEASRKSLSHLSTTCWYGSRPRILVNPLAYHSCTKKIASSSQFVYYIASLWFRVLEIIPNDTSPSAESTSPFHDWWIQTLRKQKPAAVNKTGNEINFPVSHIILVAGICNKAQESRRTWCHAFWIIHHLSLGGDNLCCMYAIQYTLTSFKHTIDLICIVRRSGFPFPGLLAIRLPRPFMAKAFAETFILVSLGPSFLCDNFSIRLLQTLQGSMEHIILYKGTYFRKL